jgi:hypothetical protein
MIRDLLLPGLYLWEALHPGVEADLVLSDKGLTLSLQNAGHSVEGIPIANTEAIESGKVSEMFGPAVRAAFATFSLLVGDGRVVWKGVRNG